MRPPPNKKKAKKSAHLRLTKIIAANRMITSAPITPIAVDAPLASAACRDDGSISESPWWDSSGTIGVRVLLVVRRGRPLSLSSSATGVVGRCGRWVLRRWCRRVVSSGAGVPPRMVARGVGGGVPTAAIGATDVTSGC